MNYWLEVLAALAAPLMAGFIYYKVRLWEAKRDATRGAQELIARHRITPSTYIRTEWDKQRGVTIHTTHGSYSQRGGT